MTLLWQGRKVPQPQSSPHRGIALAVMPASWLASQWLSCAPQAQEARGDEINSVQTRCIVKGEAQKSPLFWRFSGGFCFSQDRLFSRNSTRKPLNLIKSPIFTNAPCKTACLYNAPSMHTVDEILRFQSQSEGVSTGVWCVPGFGAGFEFALEPSKLQKEGENPGKGHF